MTLLSLLQGEAAVNLHVEYKIFRQMVNDLALAFHFQVKIGGVRGDGGTWKTKPLTTV